MSVYCTCLSLLLAQLCVLGTAQLAETSDGKEFRSDYTFSQEAGGWFKVNRERVEWERARIQCYNEGAVLASPVNANLATGLKKLLIEAELNNTEFFSGVSSALGDGVFTSIEGVALDQLYGQWDIGQPNNITGNQNCITFIYYKYAEMLNMNDEICHNKFPFICYRPATASASKKLTEYKTVDKETSRSNELGSDYTFSQKAAGWLKFHREKVIWQTAQLQCYHEGAVLASPLNADLSAALTMLLTQAELENSTRLFSGVVSPRGDHVFTSIEGVAFDQLFTEWNIDEPNCGKRQDCITFSYYNDRDIMPINDDDCFEPYPYICYRPASVSDDMTMTKRTLDKETSEGKEFRSDYTFSQEAGGWFKVHRERMEWERARIQCYNEGAVLASPVNANLATGLKKLLIQAELNNTEFFSGVSSALGDGVFTSIEGVALDQLYGQWDIGQPNNITGNQNCITFIYYKYAEILNMNDEICYNKFPFICYRPATASASKKLTEYKTVDKETSRSNELGSDYTFSQKAAGWLKFHREKVIWQTAQLQCYHEGAVLASPLNADLSAALTMLLTQAELENSTRVFSGVVSPRGDHVFTSIEGVAFDQLFTEWNIDEPNCGKRQDCITFSYYNDRDIMPINDDDCFEPYPYICYRPASVSDDMTMTKRTLDKETSDGKEFRSDYTFSQEAGGWFKVHRERVEWESARIQCYNEGAVLASPVNANLATALKKLLIQAELNNTEFFSGVSSALGDGVFTSIEGVALDQLYGQWDIGQPNNITGNQNCITFIYYKYAEMLNMNDEICYNKFPFICYRPATASASKKLTEYKTVDKETSLSNELGSDYTFSQKAAGWLKFHREKVIWQTAQLQCYHEGAVLASPLNADLSAALTMLLTQAELENSTRVFSGVVSPRGDHVFTSIEGVAFDQLFTEWNIDEPNCGKRQDCITFSYYNDRDIMPINDDDCFEPYPYICYRPASVSDDMTMTKRTLDKETSDGIEFLSGFTFSQEADGWLKLHRVPLDWETAQLQCYYEGAVLASALNDDLLTALTIFLTQAKLENDTQFFSGVSFPLEDEVFTSIEEVALDQLDTEWDIGQPNRLEGNQHCITYLYYKDRDDMLLITYENCNKKFPYICYRPASASDKLTECGTVDTEYKLDARTRHCYKFHRHGMEWASAARVCQAEGGYLAVIDSQPEADLLAELFAAHPPETLLYISSVGLHSASIGFSKRSDEWWTVQGKLLEESGYYNWNEGEPNNIGGNQQCGGIWRNGRFDDVYCDKSYAFICEKSPDSLLTGHLDNSVY